MAANDNRPVYYVTRYSRDDVSAIDQWWQLSSLQGAIWRFEGLNRANRFADVRDEYGCVLFHNMPAAQALRDGHHPI